jgi:hypothetical protein
VLSEPPPRRIAVLPLLMYWGSSANLSAQNTLKPKRHNQGQQCMSNIQAQGTPKHLSHYQNQMFFNGKSTASKGKQAIELHCNLKQ